MTDYWQENMLAHAHTVRVDEYPHVIVDLGYLKHPVVRRRLDKLMALGIGKGNVQIAYIGRVVVRIPPTRLAHVLKSCRGLKAGQTYSWVTHNWIPKGADDVRYSLR